jgi:hypothetical protein
MKSGALSARMQPGSATRLLAGILGPPALWGIRLWAGYLIVPFACAADSMIAMHAVTVATLLGIAALGVLAWRDRDAAGRGAPAMYSGGAPPARVAFMAVLGVLSAGFFFLVVIAEGVANLIIGPCL